jgi:hypothetical protein
VLLIAADDMFLPIRGLQAKRESKSTVLNEFHRLTLVILIRTCKVNADMLLITPSVTVARQNYKRPCLPDY